MVPSSYFRSRWRWQALNSELFSTLRDHYTYLSLRKAVWIFLRFKTCALLVPINTVYRGPFSQTFVCLPFINWKNFISLLPKCLFDMYVNSKSFILQVLSTYISVPFLVRVGLLLQNGELFRRKFSNYAMMKRGNLMKACIMIFRFIIILRLYRNKFISRWIILNFSFQWWTYSMICW